ncbi:Glycosyltransferase involved in cell wall bisynthesis [Candidatus Methanophagaceae archaeon]|nr:Glycosyltransferase involved in cell wall bisynthesis [Methanophagales archaeon]
MKILHLISSLETGGKERLLIDICKANDYDGTSMAVVIISNAVDDVMLSDLKSTGAKVIELKRKPGGPKLKYIYLIRNYIKGLKPQILHMHGDIEVFFGSLASLWVGNKTVCTLHDINLWRASLKGKITKRLAIRLIDKFIAISDSVKDDFMKGTSMNGKNIQVIPNGIPLQKFRRSEQSSDSSEIICVARLEYEKKGQDILIKAIAILKNDGIECHCKFVGEGESRQYLELLVKKYELTDNIEFLGNRSDVPELLANAGTFVLPSRYEGFGIVIIEAMGTGIPVIASKIDGPKEIITHGENGLLFESDNEVDLAEKIKMVINDGILRNRLIRDAFLSAQEYSIEKMCDGYLAVYNSL